MPVPDGVYASARGYAGGSRGREPIPPVIR
ncbi:hypothetical protein GA0115245_133220 [Streptomyces sp. di188]|nr:hypothetical protein GA0115238_145420 [Streptomyces sp. di50b]SCE39400.1 hypothetical protein GA0115245_133220 [Streptomyces sp. di188]